MISVQNHLQPLSGNKYLIVIFIGLYLSACSPKVQTVKTSPAPQEKEKVEEVIKPPKKFTEATISLLVPFNLQDLRTKPVNKAEIEKHAMAIDFYQGFKLGIDSAASYGLNYKLIVHDTRESTNHLDDLFRSKIMDDSHLLVGPVFPDGLKYMTGYSKQHNIPIVSPLAATQPSEFNNPNLISIVNNIDLHAQKLGDYIIQKYNGQPATAVLISTKSPGDEVLGKPLRAYFQEGKGKTMPFEEYASVFTMETKAPKNRKYVVMLSSSDFKFVTATLDKLNKMSKAGFDIDLYGHPDWQKQNYNTETLQALKTIITSSYKVDYKSPAVIDFIKKYRKAYQFEPGEFAFKGFDIGFYFGREFARHGADFLKHLPKDKHKGLQNSLSFVQDEQYGYINTSLNLLQYRNYDLISVE
ncbi:ABC transporter substrate-binding protein [Pedobacter sp.]|uniref:ABC transporter substrate-binding protein n=1 Tax=Pedobacter sp. TaxID=1411316 RepID=UPI003D7FEBCD